MVKLMSSFLRKYLPFTKAVLQRHVTYRMNFVFFTFGRILRAAVSVYLWYAIFLSSGKQNMLGFSLHEIIIYIVISDIISNVVLTSICFETIPEEVRSGLISMNLLKPINYHIQLLFSSIGNALNALIYYGLPVFLITVSVSYFAAGVVPPNIITIGLFCFSIIISFLIYFFISFLVGTISFFTTSIWGITMSLFAIISFLSGRLIPLDFFPDKFKLFIEILPFSSMVYTPSMIYMEKIVGMDIFYRLSLQMLWLILLGVSTMLFWKKAIKKLTILGG